MDISYNCLNLPSHAVTADGSSLTYTYLADGTKMLVANSGRGLRYKGSFTFSVAGANNFALESIACDEGRFALVSGGTSSPASLKDLFFVTDHLGNVRSIADVSPGLTAPVILEQNDYLPFGTKVQNSSYASITENRYRYANKEEQSIGGAHLSLLDFGARYYDHYAARWTSVDPMAGKYFSIGPYDYCANNPVLLIDEYGKSISTHTDANGKVIAIFNDGDYGVYKHVGVNIYDEVAMNHSFSYPSAGGEYMGESLQLDSFVGFNGRIQFGSNELTNLVSSIFDSNPSAISYALKAKSNGDWDLKSKINDASLLFGKYASPRDAGNFAAGMVSQSKGTLGSFIIDFGYGAYNICKNRIPLTALFCIDALLSPNAFSNMTYIGKYGEDKISKNAQDKGKEYYNTLNK